MVRFSDILDYKEVAQLALIEAKKTDENIEDNLIISDYQDREFGEKYGFLMNENKLLARGVVVVDKDGKVAYVEYVPEVTDEVDFDKALEEVKKLI